MTGAELIDAEHHPDRGGSAERMAEINRAWKQALEEFGAG